MDSVLIDYADIPQPVLLLMRIDGIIKQWRLNYNVTQVQIPVRENEQQLYRITPTVQYCCNYVPAEGGLPGNPPPFEDYVVLLKNEGCTKLEIESIKSEYQLFVDTNF